MAPLSSENIFVQGLANGLRIVCAELPHLHLGFAQILLRAGPRFESAEDNGLSHFCEHMVFRGAGRFVNSTQLVRVVEDVGGNLEAATYRDHAIYASHYAPGGLRRVFEVFAALLRAPAWRDIEVERRIVLEEMREQSGEQGEEIDADNISRALMFKGHGLAQRIDGNEANVRGFDRRHLKAHHNRFYVAKNLVLAVAGPSSRHEVLNLAQRFFGPVRSGEEACFGQAPRVRRGPLLRFVRREGSQTELRFCLRAPGELDSRAPALGIARRVLDDGMGSRLQTELVEKRGLAYELWADIDFSVDHGVFDFGAVVAHPKVSSTVLAILRCARQLANKGPSSEELTRAKRRTQWAFDAATDNPAALGEWLGRRLLFGLDADIDASRRSIRAVRASQVQRVLDDVLRSGTLCLVGVGHVTRREAQLLRQGLARQ